MSVLTKVVSDISERLAIAKEGAHIVLLMILATLIIWGAAATVDSRILLWGAVILTIVAGCLSFLFRNPHRAATDLTDLDIISPADGKIVSIIPVSESEFLKKEALRISIFLSLLDVHVNWMPVSGVVKYKKRSEGKFLPAFLDNASNRNKCVSIGIHCDDGFCMTLVQITGFVARRIKCHPELGQRVDRGTRYGMIYFGSRVDIFVPRETSLSVREGDRVYGGITVIGRKHNSNAKNKTSHS